MRHRLSPDSSLPRQATAVAQQRASQVTVAGPALHGVAGPQLHPHEATRSSQAMGWTPVSAA